MIARARACVRAARPTFRQRVDAHADLREVADAELASDAVEADPPS